MERLYSYAENNKILSSVIAFQRTMWYPAVFAVCAVIACSFDLDIVLIYFIMLSTVIAALFGRDFKPVLVSVVLTYFSIALHGDVTKLNLSNYEMGFSTAELTQLIVCVSVFIVAIVVRLAVSGELKAGIKRHAFTASILAMCTAFLLNGLFFEGYVVESIIMGIIETASFLPLYYIILCGLPKGDKTLIPYLCKLCAIAAAAIALEVIILVLKLAAGDILLKDGALNRDFLVLGWGVNNLICSMLVVFIPPIMYLAFKAKRFGWLYIIFAALLLGLMFLVQCRAAVLFGGITFVICIVICCWKGENRRTSIISAIVIAAVGIVLLIILAATGYLTTLFSHLTGGDGQTLNNGRIDIWKLGLENFTKNPVFGVGFGESAYPPDHSNYGTTMLTQNLYHNIGVQFLASMGIVGVLAFCFHLYELVRFYFKKIKNNPEVLFMGIAVLAVLMLSLVDNMFFFPCFAIFYVLFLASSEIGARTPEPENEVTDELV